MIKEILDNLIKIATSDLFSEDILEARNEYKNNAGNVYEDDKSYESKIALFLDWYIFSRIDLKSNKTILEKIIDRDKEILSTNLLKAFEGFTKNIHGIFVAKKIKEHSALVINLFDNKKYEVVEPIEKFYFSKNELFEGRLLNFDNVYCFTGNYCFHPKDSHKYIQQEVEKIYSKHQINEKELKSKTSKLIIINKSLQKTIKQSNKIKDKISNSSSESRKSAFQNELSILEVNQTELKESYLLLENEISIFTNEKIITEKKTNETAIIHKISCMHLIWERSRNIDIKDIYRN
jgi:hypothetical protein